MIQPYLFFEGRTEEAIEFYRRTLGATVNMMLRYKESPEPPPPGCEPPDKEKIMHAQIQIGETMVLMSDGRCNGKPSFQGFALSHTVGSPAEADKAFNALAEGGQVMQPLAKTFFSPSFGMLTDRFGVMWMVYVKP